MSIKSYGFEKNHTGDMKQKHNLTLIQHGGKLIKS